MVHNSICWLNEARADRLRESGAPLIGNLACDKCSHVAQATGESRSQAKVVEFISTNTQGGATRNWYVKNERFTSAIWCDTPIIQHIVLKPGPKGRTVDSLYSLAAPLSISHQSSTSFGSPSVM